MVENRKFKGHTIIKRKDTLIIRDSVEDIIIKGKLIDIKPRKKKNKQSYSFFS